MRISFHDLAIEVAKAASLRSEDQHKKVGCAILNDEGRLLSIGYNGLSPKKNESDTFWSNRDLRREYVIHAEANALSCITRYENPYLLATTLMPCSSCAINIVSYGIKKILYIEDYERDQSAKNIFKFYNIELIHYNK